jgi:ubiquinone/menaquinone biosynthesis C-methylase UbiE
MTIPSEVYDREYFLSDRCEGWDQFRSGRGLSALKQREVDMLEPGPGVRVLDAGCGRGEVLLSCAGAGARVAGIDYAEAAVELAREVLADVEGADVQRGSITELPWEDASFDRALLGDVIEHLTPEQADAGLRELRRVLAPGGWLVVHTAPNLNFLRYGWPVARIGLKLLGRSEAVRGLDFWIGESKQYHVNEQSASSLRRAMRRAGFDEVKAWIDADILRSGAHHLTAGMSSGRVMKLAARVAAVWPLRDFLGNDVYGIGRVKRESTAA